ncbi:MAG: hypothetical protein K2L86_11280, partial [Lachnospiraceae bacterium]|nr:hypothetical protein [Lachnospiraceae bacterium]
MSSEENYLDKLLNNVLEPKPTEPMNEIQESDSDIETVMESSTETNVELDILAVQDELKVSDIEEPEASELEPEVPESNMFELVDLEISDLEPEIPEPEMPKLEELEISELEPEIPEPEMPKLEELE